MVQRGVSDTPAFAGKPAPTEGRVGGALCTAELTRRDIDNPLIVTEFALVKSGTVELAQVGDRTYEILDRVLPDPEIAIVQDCMRVYREGGHDGLIGLGGGSAIDIEKTYRAAY